MIVVDKEHAKLTCVDVGMVMEEEIVLLKCEEYIHKYGEQNLLFINHISGWLMDSVRACSSSWVKKSSYNNYSCGL